MNKQLLLVIVLLVSVSLRAQIRTPEVEVRAPTTTTLNEIEGETTVSGTLTLRQSEVSGNVGTSFDNLILEQSGVNVGLTFKSSSNMQSGIAFGDESDHNMGRVLYHHNGDYMSLWTKDQEWLRILADGKMGLGTSTPAGQLHIRSGAVGGGIHGNYDNLIIEDNGENIGLSFKSSSTNNAGIAFGDAEDTNTGRILYSHNNDHMSFYVNDSERIRLQSNGRVGVGTNNPQEKLHVAGPMQVEYSVGSIKIDNIPSVGNNNWVRSSIISSRNGDLEWSDLDYKWSIGNQSGNDWTAILHTNPGELQFFTGKPGAFSLDNNTFRNTYQRMTIDGDGLVGIGIRNPSEKLHINGTVKANTFDNSSDRRWKKDITDIEEAAEILSELRPVAYSWRVEEFPEKDFDDNIHYGVIAQELEKVLPELVSTDNEGYKSVDYLGMIGLLIKGFQERGEEVERLKEELAAERATDREALTALNDRLKRLEALLDTVDDKEEQNPFSEKE